MAGKTDTITAAHLVKNGSQVEFQKRVDSEAKVPPIIE